MPKFRYDTTFLSLRIHDLLKNQKVLFRGVQGLTNLFQLKFIHLDLSERVDESCQTPKEFMPSNPDEKKTTRRLDDKEAEKIRSQERKKWEDYYQRQLEDQKKQFQNEIRKMKKKQWCAVCSKEGNYYFFFIINF